MKVSRCPLRILSEKDADNFHDCRIQGISWSQKDFTFTLDIQYIVEWIQPTEETQGNYQFRICEAELIFHNVRDPRLSIDWARARLDAVISEVRVLESGTTPTGRHERLFEIELATIENTICLWSTHYEVALLSEPVVSNVTYIET